MILFLAVLAVLFLFWYLRPRYVKLELITSVKNSDFSVNEKKNDSYSELYWWFLQSNSDLNSLPKLGAVSPDLNSQRISENPKKLEKLGIDFTELGIDFDKNNVILAFSREIKEMKFKKSDDFPYRTVSTVKTIMSKGFEANTIYIYKIPKYEVREDLRAYTETSIEK